MSLILNPYRFVAPPTGGGGIILHDTFTPSGADVSLASVTPDTVGTGYTKASASNASADIVRFDSAEAPSGYAGADQGDDNVRVTYYSNPVPTAADVLLEVEVQGVGGGSRSYCCLMARMSGGDGYCLQLNRDDVSLLRLDGLGSATALAGQDFNDPAVGDRFRLRAEGSTISYEKKPSGGSWSTVRSATDATYGSAGDAGVGFGAWSNNLGDIRTNWKLSELIIEEL